MTHILEVLTASIQCQVLTQSYPGLATMHVTVCEGMCSFCRPTPEAVSHPNKITPAALT